MFKAKMTEPTSGNAGVPTRADARPRAAAPQVEQLPTQVTVKINSLRTSGSTLATASVDLNGVFAIRGVKIVQGTKGPFVSMPSYKTGGGFKDICFPCTAEFREHFCSAVLDAYKQELGQLTQRGQASQGQEAQEPPFPGMAM